MASAQLRVIHTLDESVRIERAGVVLMEYHYRPTVDQKESPKPYIHPLATPKGHVLTVDRPHDHVWHRGLYFGWAYVNDGNFWGGASYVRGQGYVQQENNGAMVHEAWDQLEIAADGVHMAERLTWVSVKGQPWIHEWRQILVHQPENDEALLLTVQTELVPVAGQGPFRFGSPLTHGRPDPAGYSGLALRLSRAMTGGKILLSTGVEGPGAMGQRAEWLHFTGRLDGSGEHVGVAVFDHPDNPRHPTHFFVRSTPFGLINPAFCWDEEYELTADKPLRLCYGVWVHAGAAGREHVQAIYEGWRNKRQP